MNKEQMKILNNEETHLWHSWMNKTSGILSKDNQLVDRTIYEFKSMLQWLSYGHIKIAEEFEGKLPTLHRQCSHQPAEEIKQNELRCAIGKNVLECPILASLKAAFEAQLSQPPSQSLFRIMSATCAFHLMQVATGMTEGFRIDTSEGYMQDTSDRMFWQRTYQSMAMEPEDSPE